MAELSARHFFAGRVYDLQPDDILNHVWIPSHVMENPHFAERGVAPYTRHINRQGWLSSYDFEKTKDATTYRIAYVGDSFVEGTCAEEDSVPAFVQRSLHVPGKQKVEVMNTGTSSYSPTLYFLLLTKKLLDFKPDLVVLNVDMTDVFDDSLYRATLKVDEQGDPISCSAGHPLLSTHRRTERGLDRLTTFQKVLIFSREHSAVMRMILEIAERRRRVAKVSEDGTVPRLFAWCDPKRSEETQREVVRSMDMLRRVIVAVKSRSSKIVVTAVPHLGQLEGKWSLQPMDDIAAVCAAEGVPFLNPVHAFQQKLGSSSPQSIYITNDMHFNTRGYRMWGEIQLEFLNTLALP